MRLAPVAIAFAHQPEVAVRVAGEMSRTTHGARTALDACRFLCALIIGALHGEPKERLMQSVYEPQPRIWAERPLCDDILEVARGSYRRKSERDIRGTGYVVESLAAALWSFWTTGDFANACLTAVNLGDDADTTGAICGQLAGAHYGSHAIPKAWLPDSR